MNLRKRFQTLVDDNYENLWRYVSFLIGGGQATEDIVHQAFLLAFDRLAEGTEFTGDPGKWLRGVARNLVHAWWREQRKLPDDVARQLLLEDAEDASELSVKAETEEALKNCLGQLSENDRKLVEQRYSHGKRINRLAEEIGMNVASLRVRLFRIRQALKRCLENRLSGDLA